LTKKLDPLTPPESYDLDPGLRREERKTKSVTTDVFTPAQRSAVMRRVKDRDTAPELKVRRLLWRMRARYRLHRKDLPGTPDIVLPGRKLAVFVHGCFWHGHDCARGSRVPKANRDYWLAKVARNRARDIDSRAKLEAMGWRVLAVWECGLKDEEGLAAVLSEALAPKTPPPPAPSPPPRRSSTSPAASPFPAKSAPESIGR
jgi:DNA mismatch endonuclease (patch repair protein)